MDAGRALALWLHCGKRILPYAIFISHRCNTDAFTRKVYVRNSDNWRISVGNGFVLDTFEYIS